jgi:hypothetical protein
MAPVDNGRRVHLSPGTQASNEIRARDLKEVRATWLVNAEGEVRWLEVRPAQPGAGVKVRGDDGKRPHMYVPTPDVGRAALALGSSPMCPEETIEGDLFRFRVPDGLHFARGGSNAGE